jgi:ATP-binding cassette subfamily B protein
VIEFARHVWAIFLRGWRVSPGRMALAFGLIALTYLSLPLVPLALKEVTDAVVAHDAHNAGLYAAALPLIALLNIAGNRISHVVWVELCDLCLIDCVDELGSLSQGSRGLDHHERADFADRMEMLRNEGNPLYRGVQVVMNLISLAAQFALTIFLLARLQPVLLLLLALGVVPLLTNRWAWNRMNAAYVATAPNSRLSTHLLGLATSPQAAKEIRVFGLEDEMRRRLAESHRNQEEPLARARRDEMLISAAGQSVFALGYIGGLLLVVRGAIGGHHSVGDVVLAVTLAAQVNGLVFQAAGVLQFVQLSAKAYGRLAWLRMLVNDLYPRAAKTREVPQLIQDGIRLERVAFRYPGTNTDVLSDVDLHLPAGTTVAFVGENGAGKSTLVKLLCRFYDPTDGRITIDGVDLAELSPEEWRERIAAGFQDFVRYAFVARESIGVGDITAIDDEAAVLAALERADARNLVARLSAGLDTQLGREGGDGVELSGGQWQKVALGRAMMRTTPLLLILDEPTSALDAHAEHVLFERYVASARAVAHATGGIAIFVSHRFSTVRMADHIVVVDCGSIVEHGTHDQLVANGRLYADLYKLQAAAYGK